MPADKGRTVTRAPGSAVPGTKRSPPRGSRATTRLPAREGARPVDPATRTRAGRILRALYRAHPDAHCALEYQTPLDLYVATVLSAQCTDERVNKVTPALFARCRKPEDYLSLGTAGLEELIRSTGFFRSKTRNILAGCQTIATEFGGELPRTIEELVRIPGCGRKTANVILGNAFGTTGITVDTHVQRLAKRLALSSEIDPVKIEGNLQQLFAEKEWTQLSHSLIWHGRSICDARKPLCERCTLRRFCPYPAGMASGDTPALRPRKPTFKAAGAKTKKATVAAKPQSGSRAR